LFTEAEEQLSRLGLAELVNNGHTSELDVIVGGLGLGYTAAAVLDDEAVKTLKVIDVMEPVINWHQRGLVPLGQVLTEDKRCSLIKGDFFALATDSEKGFIDTDPTALVHAVLLDIDHSPEHWLNADNASFYSTASLQSVSDKLYNGGVFGLWSNDPPDETFINTLESVFSQTKTHVVSFLNPYTNEMANNTVYISSK
jgi:spermidine synthase